MLFVLCLVFVTVLLTLCLVANQDLQNDQKNNKVALKQYYRLNIWTSFHPNFIPSGLRNLLNLINHERGIDPF